MLRPLVVGLALASLGPLAPVAAQESPELRVMTFNIRYGTADDGDHVWPNRRHLVAQIIAREAPDVLAIQEALAFQLDELAPSLEGYVKLGQHRDGGTGGEFSGLYVRTDAVCHAMNAYVLMLDELPEGVLLELPEPGLDSLIRPK